INIYICIAKVFALAAVAGSKIQRYKLAPKCGKVNDRGTPWFVPYIGIDCRLYKPGQVGGCYKIKTSTADRYLRYRIVRSHFKPGLLYCRVRGVFQHYRIPEYKKVFACACRHQHIISCTLSLP